MKIRIPGWATNQAIPGDLYKFADSINETFTIFLNGEKTEPELEDGYAEIERLWSEGDRIDIDFPMPVRKVFADERIEEDKGKMAFQRGPVILCRMA